MKGVNLREIFERIRSRWILVAYSSVGLGVIVVLFTLFIPNQYDAITTMYGTQDQGRFGQLGGLAASLNLNLGGLSGEESFYIPDVVASRRTLNSVVSSTFQTQADSIPITLIHYWKVDKKDKFSLDPRVWVKDLFGKPMPPDQLRELQMKLAARILAKRISISETKSGLFMLTVRMEEPQLAADVANGIVEEVRQFSVEVSKKQAKEKRSFIEKRLDEVHNSLTEAEDALATWRKRNREIDYSPELMLESERLQREVGIQNEVFITLKQQYELARIEEISESPVVITLDQATPPIRKAAPRRLLMGIVGLLVGAMLSSLFLVVYRL